MKNTFQELDDLLAAGPVRRASHPDLTSTIAHALRHDRITAVLPGIYLPTSVHDDKGLRRRAAMLWDPDAVIVGRSSAAEQFWAGLHHDVIELASPHQHRPTPAKGFSIVRRRIPPEHVVHRDGVRYSSIALTAVDLCPELEDEVLVRALRTRQIRPEHLQEALDASPRRAGNVARRAAVLDAAGNPWSYLETLTHQILRGAGIDGWKGNPQVCLFGNVYHPDVLFEDVALAIEVDGYTYHSDDDAFQNDRDRRNDFVLSGYQVLQFTGDDAENRPDKIVRHTRTMLQNLRG